MNAGRSPRGTPRASSKYVGSHDRSPYPPHDCANCATQMARTSLVFTSASHSSITPVFPADSAPYLPPPFAASLTTLNEDAAQNGNQKIAAEPNV